MPGEYGELTFEELDRKRVEVEQRLRDWESQSMPPVTKEMGRQLLLKQLSEIEICREVLKARENEAWVQQRFKEVLQRELSFSGRG